MSSLDAHAKKKRAGPPVPMVVRGLRGVFSSIFKFGSIFCFEVRRSTDYTIVFVNRCKRRFYPARSIAAETTRSGTAVAYVKNDATRRANPPKWRRMSKSHRNFRF